MNRRGLSDALLISEGIVRKILDILKKWGAVSVSNMGVSITDAGRKLLQSIPIRLVAPPVSNYVVGKHQFGVVITGVADMVTDGIAQRNSAILAGARGATSFVMQEGMLLMPPAWNMDELDPQFANAVRDIGVVDGDVLIFVGAKDHISAVLSSITAALDML